MKEEIETFGQQETDTIREFKCRKKYFGKSDSFLKFKFNGNGSEHAFDPLEFSSSSTCFATNAQNMVAVKAAFIVCKKCSWR